MLCPFPSRPRCRHFDSFEGGYLQSFHLDESTMDPHKLHLCERALVCVEALEQGLGRSAQVGILTPLLKAAREASWSVEN